jgi:hypothetical protein
MNQQEKGKTSLVDNLLHRTASPFTGQILAVHLPKNLKVSSIVVFTKTEDLTQHLDNYRAHLDLHGTPSKVAC